jgi:hypothetical protein
MVEEALAAGRLSPGLDDTDLLVQTLWAGLHGVVALQIAKANDPWCDWRSDRQLGALPTCLSAA